MTAPKWIAGVVGTVRDAIASSDDRAKTGLLDILRQELHKLSPQRDMPVDCVRWIAIDDVQANDYNPNAVAPNEMRLLHTSISHDGYTQPVVAIIDKRCEILLPCGHFSTVEGESAVWEILNPLSGLSDIPLELSTAKEASANSTGGVSKTGKADTASKSVSQTGTMESVSANGCATSGVSGAFTSSTASAMSGFGTSPGSTTLGDCLLHVCPTCLSSDPEQKNFWQRLVVKTPSAGASGPITNFEFCESAGQASERRVWQNRLDAALTQCGQNETNSASKRRRGIYALATDKSKAIIVDGFHRYSTCRQNKDIQEMTKGFIPVVVIDKSIEERMASTVRHNRARGKHSVAGMANMVFAMLENPEYDDARICNEVGLTPEELTRLKHVTGFAKLFENGDYRKSWQTARQIKLKRQYEQTGKCETEDSGDGDEAAGNDQTVLAEP